MNIIWINKITDEEPWKTTQLELTKSLRKRGHNVNLILAKGIGEKKSNKENITYIPTVPRHIFSSIIFSITLFIYSIVHLNKKKGDVILVDGTSIWLPLIIALNIFRIPIILDIRDIPVGKNRSKFFSYSVYLGKYFVDGLTTISPELEEKLKKKYKIHDKKIGIWSSGVSIKNFKIDISKQKFFKQANTKKFIIMHHGSYGTTRGVDNTIESIGRLDDSIKKQIKFLIVGIPLDKQEEFLYLVKKNGVKEQVEIIPPVEYKKMPYYIQQSDVGIIPLPPNHKSYNISVPLKTLEYLAMEKPIIATNIEFHKKIFEKGNCGILIDSNSPERLSEAISYMYKNKSKFKSMGKIGKKIVEQNHTWDIKALDIEKFLKKFLAGH